MIHQKFPYVILYPILQNLPHLSLPSFLPKFLFMFITVELADILLNDLQILFTFKINTYFSFA